MLELRGKYTTAKVFTDNCEDEAIAQVTNIINSPEFADCQVRIMPDVHSGKGIVIGFSSTMSDYANPEHIGVDIGCGMKSIFFNKPLNNDDYALFEHRLLNQIPVGMNINVARVIDEKEFLCFLNREIEKLYHKSNGMFNLIRFNSVDDIDAWYKKFGMSPTVFWHSLGTLGSGNHFMEYGESVDGSAYAFTVHTGSRNLGVKVFNYWNKIATGDKAHKAEIKEITKEAKKEYSALHNGDMTGFSDYLQDKIETFKKTVHTGYLSEEPLKEYLTDMVVTQLYAAFNRKTICRIAASIMNSINDALVVDDIESVHNYIDASDHVIRKGAIRSYVGEKMIIPFNMRDGLAICEGKSNDDWNCTAPHGAGRLLSRSKAFATLNADVFKKQMEDAGVYTTTANQSTLDEAPDAYKPFEEILELIKPTAVVLYLIKPKINIKGSEKRVF